MTDDELVEKVARNQYAMEGGTDWDSWGKKQDYRGVARAAIALLRPIIRAEALEAAAQVCASPHGGWVSDDRLACADEIRALKSGS